jgi:hypothetical protein
MLKRVTFMMLLLVGCDPAKPKAGDSCIGSEAVCSSSTVALACYAGKYLAVTCPGPGGCGGTGSISCGEGSQKSVGDTCFKPGLGLCDAAKKIQMKCSSSGLWEKDVDCDANGEVCKDNGTTISCGT